MNQIVRQMEELGLIVDNTHLLGRLHLRTLAVLIVRSALLPCYELRKYHKVLIRYCITHLCWRGTFTRDAAKMRSRCLG